MYRLFTLTCCLLSALAAAAGPIKFKSGEVYRLVPLAFPQLAVCPAPANAEEITCAPPQADRSYWTLTQEVDGFFTIRHAESRRYLTYDGLRTTTRRYVRLSQSDHGEMSRWHIYAGERGLIICCKSSQNLLLNVRRGSYIVGTYNELRATATENERFLLVDRKGRIVTHFGGTELRNEPANPGGREPLPAVQATLQEFTLDGRSGFREQGRGQGGATSLFTVDESVWGRDYKAAITAAGAPEGAQLYVDGERQARGKARFPQVTAGRTYRLAWVLDGDTVTRAAATFTTLPILSLSEARLSGTTFVNALLSWNEARGRRSVHVKARWRGDYSLSHAKRSIGLKVVDEAGKKQDIALCGLRSDNYWILDAMAIDPARMRNRVAQDLWQDIATPPYYTHSVKHARTASRGCLVEVFLDGSYQGVYNLCERIDREQTQVAKADANGARGCLYKADHWSRSTRWGGSDGRGYSASPTSGSWGHWQIKYPEPSRKHQAEWGPLCRAEQFAAESDDSTFCREVGDYFDLPVLVDYWLFIELLHATDNSGKNMYWAVYDCRQSGKLTPIPWDLDGTFGRNWDGSRGPCAATNNYDNYLRGEGKQNYLVERLYRLDAQNWRERVRRRYAELRRGPFSADALLQRFEHYRSQLEKSGAGERERRRWDGQGGRTPDYAGEIKYLEGWLKERLATLDRKYDF